MCRLYGFIATDPTSLECSLVTAQNALVNQSDRDGSGTRHADGWGIAHWPRAQAKTNKNTHPAFADKQFTEVATSVTSHAVIAHVRSATTGAVALENTHPFTHGPWAFAHNGTLSAQEHVRTHMEYGTVRPPDGETDSEAVFRWLLNRMGDHGLDPDEPAGVLDPILDLLEAGVQDLVRFGLVAGADHPPKLNFVLSDGVHLGATRWGNTLHWTHRRGVTDCMVCGTSHCPGADEAYKAVVVASEPLTDENWLEVPDGTVFGAARDGKTAQRSLIGTPSV